MHVHASNFMFVYGVKRCWPTRSSALSVVFDEHRTAHPVRSTHVGRVQVLCRGILRRHEMLDAPRSLTGRQRRVSVDLEYGFAQVRLLLDDGYGIGRW